MLQEHESDLMNNGTPQDVQNTPLNDPFSNAEPVAPVQPEPSFQTQQTPPAGGSYYSPRSGYVPPNNNGYPPQNPGGGSEPPKKAKSHKGLKALAVFAGIAFLSYASIQCYQFATENEAIRSFLARDSSITEESLHLQSEGSVQTTEHSKAPEPVGTSSSENSVVTAQNWIDLAARDGAMKLPDIVDKVMPSSVGVASTFVYQSAGYPMFGFQPTEREMSATGTGIIMSESGYIITNAHVIYDGEYNTGLAREIQVVLNEDYYAGETQLAATVVGYDTEEDIAVLKVDTNQKLIAAEFGSSDDLRVGELVVAIGNPLGFDLFGSVTTGIVSALNREVTINETTMNLIQTDAAINSGNSGGPLINSYGQVIGINSAKLSSSYGSASVEGLCFAIPMSHAKNVIDDLINYGYVRGKPLIGIKATDVTEEVARAYGFPVGIFVTEVTKGGAAELAGIQARDVIIAVNGESVSTYDELNAIKDHYKAGDTITLTVTRNGTDLDFTLILQEKVPTDIS